MVEKPTHPVYIETLGSRDSRSPQVELMSNVLAAHLAELLDAALASGDSLFLAFYGRLLVVLIFLEVANDPSLLNLLFEDPQYFIDRLTVSDFNTWHVAPFAIEGKRPPTIQQGGTV